jgi:membrane protein DedA with SNARE-associated domain
METLHWLIQSVSYWLFFLILFISGLGFPIPEEITLMAGAASAAMGNLDIFWVIVISYVAIMLGDAVAFGLGRYFGPQIYQSRFARFIGDKKRIRKARYLFFKRGSWAVAIARFLPGLRVTAFFVAGSMSVSWFKFLLVDSIALILSAPVGLGLGWFLGSSLLTTDGFAKAQEVLSDYHVLVFGVIGTILVIAIGSYIYRRHKKKQRRTRRSSQASQ